MNERQLIDGCLEYLHGRYTIVSAIVAGSAASESGKALDLDLCVVVKQGVLDRGRFSVSGDPVDLFVCGEERVRAELHTGLQHHLKSLFAGGRHVYGVKATSDDLIAIARAAVCRPAPAPLPGAAFAYRSKPHGLLKKFHDVRNDDPGTAGFIVSALVQASVDAFFALNRVWVGGVRQTVGTIRARDSQAAAALERVTSADLSTLCEYPELLDDMVRRLVGDEAIEDVTWIVRSPGAAAMAS
jgi:hypothetical protein